MVGVAALCFILRQAKAVRTLLHRNICVDILNQNEYDPVPPLIDAASAADLDAIRLLVEARADINFKTADGASAMNKVQSRPVKLHLDSTLNEGSQKAGAVGETCALNLMKTLEAQRKVND